MYLGNYLRGIRLVSKSSEGYGTILWVWSFLPLWALISNVLGSDGLFPRALGFLVAPCAVFCPPVRLQLELPLNEN